VFSEAADRPARPGDNVDRPAAAPSGRIRRSPAVSIAPCRRRGWHVYALADSGVPAPRPCAPFWRPWRDSAPAPPALVFWPPPHAPISLPTSAYALAVKNMPRGF